MLPFHCLLFRYGSWGYYQVFQVAIVIFSMLQAAFQQLMGVFIGKKILSKFKQLRRVCKQHLEVMTTCDICIYRYFRFMILGLGKMKVIDTVDLKLIDKKLQSLKKKS
jgi:hypothetical protein